MRLLLLSNSTQHGRTMLDHAESAIREHLQDVAQLVFVPYALKDLDSYTDKVGERFAAMGTPIRSIHEFDDAAAAVEAAEAIYVGGGNSFRLLQELQNRGLIEPLRARVDAGMPYMGASAGTNMACPTIRTTNDMPIVEPASFDALGLIPFQINPHYLDPDPDSPHMGETRETRLSEFHEENTLPVLGLREGGWLQLREARLMLHGERNARLFRKDSEPEEFTPGSDLSFLLNA